MKKLMIVGFGESAYSSAVQIIPEQHDLWTLNNACETGLSFHQPIHTIFYMHTEIELGKNKLGDGTYLDYYKQLGEQGVRIMLCKKRSDIPNSCTYPRPPLDIAGSEGYFHGSSSWMLALAIAEGYEHIRIYGLDMQDYWHKPQRDSYLYWLGVAAGRGIQIDGVTPVTENTFTYGYDATIKEYQGYHYRQTWSHIPLDPQFKRKLATRAAKNLPS